MADPRIFICYRHEDSGDRAHHLHDLLRGHFGGDEVFIDLDVPPAVDVRRYITDRLSLCAVLVVVIGPDWLTIAHESGVRRLDSKLDYVRLEIATALNGGTPIVPVLVKGARMPRADQLPAELARLADRNALQLSDGTHWQDGVRRLITTVENILPPRSPRSRGEPESHAPGERAPTAIAIWRPIRGHPVVAALALVAAAVVAAILLTVPGSGSEPLRMIYSSLPERELRQLAPVASNGATDASVMTDERTREMERAMRLALEQAGGMAGDVAVRYEALDDSDATGASPAAVVQANARRAAHDDRTVVYIGDFTSDETQQSLPILSRARIPQISVSSTRVGLTRDDPRGDVDEPARYYPKQPGYRHGYRNFVRIIPRTTVHARALVALMSQRDGCKRVAMIDDNSAYGEALANDILAYNDHRMVFVFSQSVGPRGRYEHLIERTSGLHVKPDCFVYSGTRNPNTVEIFKDFARELPGARLYGTNGVIATSFYDHRRGGLPPGVAKRVEVMVPLYDAGTSAPFVTAFEKAYKTDPGPYAIYAYEAMQLALDAIAQSGGDREAIRDELLHTSDRRDSMLGRYSIDPSTGDILVRSYGVSRIVDGRLAAPQRAPQLAPR